MGNTGKKQASTDSTSCIQNKQQVALFNYYKYLQM